MSRSTHPSSLINKGQLLYYQSSVDADPHWLSPAVTVLNIRIDFWHTYNIGGMPTIRRQH